MSDAPNAEYLAKAEAVAAKIKTRAAELLAPLEREMRIMKWRPEYCAIMWEVVAREALAHAVRSSDGL